MKTKVNKTTQIKFKLTKFCKLFKTKVNLKSQNEMGIKTNFKAQNYKICMLIAICI